MKWRLYPLKLYFSALPIAILSGISIILNIFSWMWLWLQIPGGETQVFLHYNVLFGVDQVGDGWKIFYVPLLGLVILIVNMLVGWILYRTDKFMAHLLLFFATLCQIFLVIASFILVFLNV